MGFDTVDSINVPNPPENTIAFSRVSERSFISRSLEIIEGLGGVGACCRDIPSDFQSFADNSY